ncbi:MAG: hypothetical protein NXI30_18925 [bacterium]|nr:hypothetical protein [bacterium]
MAIRTADELFSRLSKAREVSEVEVILKEIGDSGTVGLNETFGPLGCKWVPYGATDSNASTIGLGSKPGRSLTERITNAMDAVLELKHHESGSSSPSRPFEAAADWFGRPASGAREGLFQVESKEGDLSRHIGVILSDSGVAGSPTIDVVDDGIGLTADEMPSTILSLQKGNKIKKPYLIGAFGQGGASTLAFCKYAVFFSRDHESPDRVAFTIARLMDPGEEYDLDVYVYLTIHGKVPSIDAPSGDLSLYDDAGLKRPPRLQHGTIVRHIAYELPSLDKTLQASPGNLYHYLHLSLFDSLLPFRVMDIREGRTKDERVGGSRNRLMKYVDKSDGSEEEDDSRISVIHHNEMEYIVPLASKEPSIGVEYWVLEAKRKNKGELKLRSSSSDLFVNRAKPIVATVNGQNQGELPAKFIKDLGLGMVSKHIVIHLDASRTCRATRRELFSTTREDFKERGELKNLEDTLAKILSDDPRLAEIEEQLTNRFVDRESKETNKKVKRQITSLLRDAGFTRTVEGEGSEGSTVVTDGSGGGGSGSDEPTRPRPRTPRRPITPLPTLPFPDVTKWDIAAPKDKVRLPLNGRALLRIETDADWKFDQKKLISLEFDPARVEVASVSQLKGGRKQWRLRPVADSKVGDVGTVTAVLRTPNGGELRTAIQYEILPPRTAGDKASRGLIPDFDVLAISPDSDDDIETWNELWPQHEDASREKKSEVAYKVLKAKDKTIVYYSTAYEPYQHAVERIKSKSKAAAELFEENYQVWIGYHAILQLKDDQAADDAEAEKLEAERCRVAQVQVRVASQLAELQRKVARADD